MAVVTKQVTGRRSVHYESLDDLLRDAEQLAGGEVIALGNWSLGQIMSHLAISMSASIDGFPFQAPLLFRVLGPLLFKKRFLTKPVPAGFKIPRKGLSLMPNELPTEDGLEALRAAIERLRKESNRVPNPALGRLTVDEWNQFHLRHAEMHMSFAVPKSEA